MIKIDLITGFLGSGKTTFIKKYATYLLFSWDWDLLVIVEISIAGCNFFTKNPYYDYAING